MSLITQNVKKLLFSRRKEGKPLKVGNTKSPLSPIIPRQFNLGVIQILRNGKIATFRVPTYHM